MNPSSIKNQIGKLVKGSKYQYIEIQSIDNIKLIKQFIENGTTIQTNDPELLLYYGLISEIRCYYLKNPKKVAKSTHRSKSQFKSKSKSKSKKKQTHDLYLECFSDSHLVGTQEPTLELNLLSSKYAQIGIPKANIPDESDESNEVLTVGSELDELGSSDDSLGTINFIDNILAKYEHEQTEQTEENACDMPLIFSEIINYYEQSINGGNTFAMLLLGDFYHKLGNIEMMIKYYNLGVMNDDCLTAYKLMVYYKSVYDYENIMKCYKCVVKNIDCNKFNNLAKYY